MTTSAEAQVFSDQERKITLAGVMLVFLLSALDQTIVSTAMPRIVSQLQGLNLYAWVTTGYMLSSTVMVPIYGKLNDIFGRKPVLLTSISLFVLGSMLCGMAGEFGRLPVLGGGMSQLIVFRAIQGIGGGGLFTSAFAIIADLYPPRERAKFAGLFGSVFGVASILGPLVGGFLTDLGDTHLGPLTIAGWRWVFYVNLPISCLSMFMIAAKMPKLTHRIPGKIDLLGAFLLVTTFVPLLLALTWGGRDHPWMSAQVLGLVATGLVSLGLFLWVEATAPNPILSLSLFKNRVFASANAASFFISMAFMGSMAFLPLYMQLGQGVAATTSGLSMLALMLGLLVSSTVCGQIVSRTGKYKAVLISGVVLMMVGLFFIAQVGAHTTTFDLCWRLLIMGVGLGPTMSTFNLVVQNGLPRQQLGVASASTQFFRQIGGTVGVALFGAVLTHNLAIEMARLPRDQASQVRPLGLSDLQQLALPAPRGATAAAHPAAAKMMGLRESVAKAITAMFVVALGLAGVALVLVLLIPVLPLAPRGATAGPPPSVSAAEPAPAQG